MSHLKIRRRYRLRCQPKEVCHHLRAYPNAVHEGVGVTDTAKIAAVTRGDSEYCHLKFTELAPMTAKQVLIIFFSELSIL